MYLSRLAIQNYRSIKSLDVLFGSGKNVIVGRNNVGKSNIIKAIDLMLGEYSPTYYKSENITANDFYAGDTSKPIFIWCELTRPLVNGRLEELNDDEISKNNFFRLYLDRELTKPFTRSINDFEAETVGNIFFFGGEDGQAELDNNNIRKCWIGNKPYCKRTTDIELRDSHRFAFAFRCYENEGQFKKEMVCYYRGEADAGWIEASSSNIRTALIQSAVIPSFRDPKDQLRITAYSWFGKLLRRYVDTEDEELALAFNGVRLASDKLFQTLKQEVSDERINVAFPNTTISFQFNPDTKQDIHKSTLIYVDDGFNSELKDKGSGIQSAVMIALFDFYVRNVAHSVSSLLTVEEPEVYLHPHGRRVLADRFSSFLAGGTNQLILTTHSSEFISNLEDSSTIICVSKGQEGSAARNVSFDDIKKRQILIKKQNAEMFFADGVILTEGADKYFVQESARIFADEYEIKKDGVRRPLSSNWLNEFNVSVLNCGGKTELQKYAQILTEAGIPFYTTADFDFFRNKLVEYMRSLGFDQSDIDRINALKSRVVTSQAGKSFNRFRDIQDADDRKEVGVYLGALKDKGIFVFSGDLESFYIESPEFDKEAGVIETLSKVLETGRPLSEFVSIKEYVALLRTFAAKALGIEIERKVEHDQAPDEQLM